MDIKQTYGTISEFFFMLSVGIDTLLIPVFKRFEEIVWDLEQMNKMRDSVPKPKKDKFEKELQMMKSHLMIYEIVLQDSRLI